MCLDIQEQIKRLKDEVEVLGIKTGADFKFKKNKHVKQKILDLFPYLNDYTGVSNSSLCLHVLENEIVEPIACKHCGSVITVLHSVKDIPKYCSRYCAGHDPSRMEASRQTCERKYGVRHPSTLDEFKDKMKRTNNDRYGVDWTGQSVEIQKSRIKTNMDRYGVPFTCMDPDIRSRQDQTRGYVGFPDSARYRLIEESRKKYGTDYPIQAPEVRAKCMDAKDRYLSEHGVNGPLSIASVKEKFEATCLKRYNTQWPMQSVEIRSKCTVSSSPDQLTNLDNVEWMQANAHLGAYQIADLVGVHPTTVRQYMHRFGIEMPRLNESSFERDIRSIINSHNIKLVQNDRRLLDGLELDFYLPDHRIAIELNGIYWHSTQFKKDPKCHLIKTEQCESKNIQLIQIFENEWIEKKEIVINKLKSLIGTDDRDVVYARACSIVAPNSTTTTQFLEQHHIQGCTKSQIKYGLEHNGELVALITLNVNNRSKDKYLELNRYATSKRVVGGFSKLLNHFWKMNPDIEKIVSFADRRYSSRNNMYESNGWKLVDVVSPGYGYVVGRSIKRREHFMKHKLEKMLENYDPNLTERENCENHGLYRIYDCGLLKYEMYNK